MRHHFTLTLLLVLTGCSSMKINDFADATPAFYPEEYFQGKLKAYGIFEDRFGDVRAQFIVDIDGSWDGETLTLVEDFVYNTGATEQRIWKITKQDDDTYSGTAGDVVGQAIGKSAGNALQWTYTLDLKVDDSTLRVKMDDWMFLMDEKTLVNRARMKKYGVEIGEVSIFFTKL